MTLEQQSYRLMLNHELLRKRRRMSSNNSLEDLPFGIKRMTRSGYAISLQPFRLLQT